MKFRLENEEINIPQSEKTADENAQVSVLNPDSIRTMFANPDSSMPAADMPAVTEIPDSSFSTPETRPVLPETPVASPSTDSSTADYHEIADQVFNLVNNDSEKCAELKNDIQEGNIESVIQWFNTNVKADELQDLLDTENGQNPSGLIRWLIDNPDYFFKGQFKDIKTLDQLKGTPADTSRGETGKETIKKVNQVDDQILSTKDESSEDDTESSEDDTIPTDGKRIIHKRHLLNKVIITINNDDVADYQVYEKYYILKNMELGSIDKLDDIENALDKKKISYYDFANGSCKIYDSNEVELNRIFESQDLDVRCKDIRKYTENEISTNKVKSANTKARKKLRKQEGSKENKNSFSKGKNSKSKTNSSAPQSSGDKNKTKQIIIYMTDSTFENYVRKLQKMQLWYKAPKITVSVTNTLEGRECHVNVTVRKKTKTEDAENFSTSFKKGDEMKDAEKALSEFTQKMIATNFSLEHG